MSDKPAEQAYHARGAGRDISSYYRGVEAAVELLRAYKLPPQAERNTNVKTMNEYIEKIAEDILAHRESAQAYAELPGADTGTTSPGGGRAPNDTSPMYRDDVIAAIRQQKQSTAAERGTTPPVEQGAYENEAARTCAKCGKTERGWKYNRCPDCGELAPDHAREGALRRLVTKWRAGRVGTESGIDIMLHGSKWAAELFADELEGVMADGRDAFVEHAKKCVKCWATLRKDSRDAPCAEGAKLLAQSICEAAFGADGKEGGE